MLASRPKRKPTRPTPKPKAASRTPKEKIEPVKVELVRGKGSRGKGGGPGGEAWTVLAEGKRAGAIFINLIDEPPVGRHASIQIFLNQPSQGRGIGRVAYRQASEQSGYDEIYAHMRKSNVASRRAAEVAGYVDVTPEGFAQLLMKWSRG